MIVTKINWESVQSRISACRHMAEAGEEDKGRDMLREFAKEIVDKTRPQRSNR